MNVSSAISDKTVGEVPARPKRHSAVFLGVFAAFLISTTICVAGSILGVLSAKPSHHDTQCFWTSGYLLVHGHNPYDQRAVINVEMEIGVHLNSKAIFMTREPPSALFLMAPLGWFGARQGVIVWAVLLAVCLALSVRNITALVDDAYERSLLGLAWCFAPVLACIETGQTGLIVLLGLTLFLRFRESSPLVAGVAISLCAIKPHLFLPFFLVLLAWVVMRRKWVLLTWTALAFAAESGIPAAFDHAVWPQYFAAMRTVGIVNDFVPTLGTGLRFLLDRKAMWLQFVPAALGCGWALWYFFKNYKAWDWKTHGSLLTLVSLTVAPYAWFTDQVLALPAILFVILGVSRFHKGELTLLLAIMGAIAIQMMFSVFYFKPDMVLGFVWIGWYLYASGAAASAGEVAVVS